MKRKPKKINYMDMKIPFETFRIPKAKSEQLKLINRFEAEFGKEYSLNEWIDPCYDIDPRTLKSVYIHDSIEEKIERIRRRNNAVIGLRNAISNNDKEKITQYNELRELPPLPESDNGWNVLPAEKLTIVNEEEDEL